MAVCSWSGRRRETRRAQRRQHHLHLSERRGGHLRCPAGAAARPQSPGMAFHRDACGSRCLRFERPTSISSWSSTAAPFPRAARFPAPPHNHLPQRHQLSQFQSARRRAAYRDPGGLPSQGFSSSENSGTFSIQLFPTDVVLTLFDCFASVIAVVASVSICRFCVGALAGGWTAGKPAPDAAQPARRIDDHATDRGRRPGR